MERKNLVTFKGSPITLTGPELKVGDAAPDFTAVGQDLKPVSLADFKGQTLVVSAVPSIDTGVCADQTRRFNQEAAALDARVITISADLPFAQKRFCGENKIESSAMISDFKDRTFANNYGLYMKELGLIARSVTVIDKQGKIAYIEIVKEMATHPDYDAALAAVKKLTAK